jgi:hypothetical protein
VADDRRLISRFQRGDAGHGGRIFIPKRHMV